MCRTPGVTILQNRPAKRTEVVAALCQRLTHEGWKVLRDSAMMRPGELMPGFMKRIGRAEHVMDPYPDPFRPTPQQPTGSPHLRPHILESKSIKSRFLAPCKTRMISTPWLISR
jgi:hypothetical protein